MLSTLLANTQGLTVMLFFKNPMVYAGHQRGSIHTIRNYLIHSCLRVGKQIPEESLQIP